jgi:hypothetical protein
LYTVLIGIVVFLIVFPAAVGLESARNIFLRIRKPHHLVWERKWTNIMWFYVIAPSLVLVLVFGVLVMGNAAHFRTAHGVSTFH